MNKTSNAKQILRVLKFLGGGGFCAVLHINDAKEDKILLQALGGGSLMCDLQCLATLEAADLIERSKTGCTLTKTGLARLKRAAVQTKSIEADIGAFRAQHLQLAEASVMLNGQRQTVMTDEAESPLTRLRRMKAPAGGTWLDDAAFEAGERLRADFTHGRLMQRTTSSWNFGAGSNARSDPSKTNITEQAMDARTRMERALETVGPELAGVLMDVCCFLKGLESVERDRRWPPRSAKLMLRTGLNLLARHYGTRAGAHRGSGHSSNNQSAAGAV